LRTPFILPILLKSRTKLVNAFLRATIAQCPKLAARLEYAERVTDAEAIEACLRRPREFS